MAIYEFEKTPVEKVPKSKIVGMTIICVSLLMLIALFSNLIVFLKTFLLGALGLFAFPFFIVSLAVGFALVTRKKYVLTKKYIVYLSCSLVSLLSIIQLIIFLSYEGGLGEFLILSYTQGFTAGGILISLVIAPFKFLLNNATAIVFFVVSLIVFVSLIIDYFYYAKNIYVKTQSSVVILKEKKDEPFELKNITVQKENIKPSSITLEAKLENEKKNGAKIKLGLEKRVTNEKSSNINLPPPPIFERIKDVKLNQTETQALPVEKPISRREYILSRPQTIELSPRISPVPKKVIEENVSELKTNQENQIKPSKIFHEEIASNYFKINSDEEKEHSYIAPFIAKNIEDEKPIVMPEKNILNKLDNLSGSNFSNSFEQNNIVQEKMLFENELETKRQQEKAYIAPPLDLITTVSTKPSFDSEQIIAKRIQLENALEMFKVPAKVIGVIVGPAVTRFELEMPAGISVKKLIAHADDIALVLAANGGIRIEAPIPGRSAVGVEVPNDKISMVSLRDILSSQEFISSKSPLTFALGKDINGNAKICDLAKMPHLLIAGATNSGKSVCLNSVIISLIYKSSPEDLKLILVDPKRVEFTMYNELPHLLLQNVITETSKALNALNWAINEMERRYGLFQILKVRNLGEYNLNEKVIAGEEEKLPLIVIIIDELADLMSTNKKEFEEKIMRLAQKARASGIHLILATQRPSVDVITGTIKANLTSRISFAVTSYQDSKTILDQAGAEKLLGKGDMLFAPSDQADPKRIQGCFISGKEVENIVDYIIANNAPSFSEEVENSISNSHYGEDLNSSSAFDELMPQALKYVIESNQATISVLQRKLAIGFPRAARIIDQMEEANFISASDGSKPRTVHITMEQFLKIFGDKE
ncbi:MAG: DNA translocase FtsK [Clostridia bacterium]